MLGHFTVSVAALTQLSLHVRRSAWRPQLQLLSEVSSEQCRDKPTQRSASPAVSPALRLRAARDNSAFH